MGNFFTPVRPQFVEETVDQRFEESSRHLEEELERLKHETARMEALSLAFIQEIHATQRAMHAAFDRLDETLRRIPSITLPDETHS